MKDETVNTLKSTNNTKCEDHLVSMGIMSKTVSKIKSQTQNQAATLQENLSHNCRALPMTVAPLF